MTQAMLAEMLPVAVRTVERWEQTGGRLYDPSPLAVARMKAIEAELGGKKVRRRNTQGNPAGVGAVMPSIR